MNAKKSFLFGIIATICLPVSVTFAGPRSSHGSSFSASHATLSRPALTASRGGFASAPHIAPSRAAFTPRVQAGLTSVAAGKFTKAHAFNQTVGASQIPANRTALASASTRHWSGNGSNGYHHQGHHHNNVFIGGFYPYSWSYPYSWYEPYGYGYYSAAQPAVYDSAASSSYDGDSLVAELQSSLARAGFYRGAIDGIMGPETRRAIRAFERAHGLPVDGVIDDQLLSTMDLR